ncbi:MAG: lysophospholipid acyltransferase family protein, partial [Methylococcaceae bacterium]
MFLKKKLKSIKFFFAGILGSLIIRLLISTIRIIERPDNYPEKLIRQGENIIFAYWHAFMLVPAYTARNLGIKVMVSQHTDGEYITRVIERLGFTTVRGSTTRGGVKALLKMIKDSKEGTAIAITPDGPRGPRLTIQPGIIYLSQKTGFPIIPTSLGLTSYWELPSWDKFRIPKPFSKAALIYGEPIHIP